jgi:hypothetical protein
MSLREAKLANIDEQNNSNVVQPQFLADSKYDNISIPNPVQELSPLHRMATRVLAFDARSGTWKTGQIVGVSKTGKYDVSFDEGKEALDLLPSQVHVLPENLSIAAVPIEETEKRKEGLSLSINF